jgi:hypothetical protein
MLVVHRLAGGAMLAAFLASCSATHEVEPVAVPITEEVVIVHNPDVFERELDDVILRGFLRNGFKAHISQAPRADARFVVTYSATQRWDNSGYLADAEVILFRSDRPIGRLAYHAPSGGFQPAKWDSVELKIGPLLDEMLGGGMADQASASAHPR